MDIKKVAELARLQISEQEETLYDQQLSSIVNYFVELEAIETKGIEPMVTPVDLEPYWREDKKESTLTTDEALKNAPEKMGNLFKVPPVV